MTEHILEQIEFMEGGGIGGHQCGDCLHFGANHCLKFDIPVEYGDVCKFFEANTRGNLSAEAAGTGSGVKVARSLELYITRVAEDEQTGERRWFANASGIDRDLYEERMSIPLYKDFLKRIVSREEVPAFFASRAWSGGLPYLGIAHYLDLDGDGIVGECKKIWIDGNQLKARGTFKKSKLGDLCYRSIRKDKKDNIPQNGRVRVSIAFIDWGHEHVGHGVFTRKSLIERCPMCERGLGEKVYKLGHMVHLALTRRPAYPTATIDLEERSMNGKSIDDARAQDAASIVGEEAAEKLDKKSALTQRAAPEIDPKAVVIRDEGEPGTTPVLEIKNPADPNGDPLLRVETAAVPATVQLPLDGAKTLAEADAFLERSQPETILDSWGILVDTLGNIASSDVEDQRAAILGVVSDFQNRVDVMAVRTLEQVNQKLEGIEIVQPVADPVQVPAIIVEDKEDHVLDGAIQVLRTAFDDAVASPIDQNSRLAMIQPAINELAEVIHRSTVPVAVAPDGASAAGGVDIAAISQLLEKALAPIQNDISSLKERAVAVANPVAPITPVLHERHVPVVPARRSLSAQQDIVRASSVQPAKPGSITAIARRSVGLSN